VREVEVKSKGTVVGVVDVPETMDEVMELDAEKVVRWVARGIVEDARRAASRPRPLSEDAKALAKRFDSLSPEQREQIAQILGAM